MRRKRHKNHIDPKACFGCHALVTKFSEVEPDPPYADHDASVIQGKPRCVRLLAISSLLPVFTILVTSVHAQSPTPGNTAEPAILPELKHDLDQSRARLEERLDAGKVSPEQRTILIEAWLSENAALQKRIAQERQSQASEILGTTPEAATPHAPIPPDATPLQRDIIEMENEILDFRNSLSEIQLTHEQRAIQVEAFLAINKDALKELEGLKREHSSDLQSLPADHQVPSAPSTAETPADVHPASEYTAKLAQLRDIQTEATKLNPEARAVYLESKIETINRLQHEIATASNLEIPAETVPTNINPPSK